MIFGRVWADAVNTSTANASDARASSLRNAMALSDCGYTACRPRGTVAKCTSQTSKVGAMEQIPRRSVLQLGSAGFVGMMAPRVLAADQAVAQATRAMPAPRIKDLSVIETAPGGVRLTVVKI